MGGGIFIASCSGTQPPELNPRLELSVASDVLSLGSELTCTFTVVSGVGPFRADVSANGYDHGPDARLTVDGRFVAVEMMNRSADVTVSDSAGGQTRLTITTDNDSFDSRSLVPYYGFVMHERLDFGFGGPYRAVATDDYGGRFDIAVADNVLTVKPLLGGASCCVWVSDSLGIVRRYDLRACNGEDIVDDRLLEVTVYGGARLTFPFRWGRGWKIKEGQADAETFVWGVGDLSTSHMVPCCDTFCTVARASADYLFEDMDGNQARLRITAE